MNREKVWQNFTIGSELDVSGILLYNAVCAFDKLDYFDNPEEIFEILYNFSVGIERLQKIVIILSEFDLSENREIFEEAIRTHCHISLIERIRKNHPLKFSQRENKFLRLLSDFYKNMRYDRFSFKTEKEYDVEKNAFIDFLSSLDGVNLTPPDTHYPRNSAKTKKILGKAIYRITSQLYDIIHSECSRLNLYTYEIRTDSKAAKIFLSGSDSINFLKENLYKKELLYYLISNKKKIVLPNMDALSFDEGLLEEHFSAILNQNNFSQFVDEAESLWEDVENKKARLSIMDNFELILKHRNEPPMSELEAK